MSKIVRALVWVVNAVVQVLEYLLWLLTTTVKRVMLLGTLLGSFVLLWYFGYMLWNGMLILSGFSLVSVVVLVHLNIILNRSMEEQQWVRRSM